MNDLATATLRAVRRAAPRRPAVPSGDGAAYPAREGLQWRAVRRAAPRRPAVPSGDGAAYPTREGLQ
jgi:hypothetical protein